MQQAGALSEWQGQATVWPLWHKVDSLQAQLVNGCCSQAADVWQHQQDDQQHLFGVTWLEQVQQQVKASVPQTVKVPPTVDAMHKGLLQPDAILQLAAKLQPYDTCSHLFRAEPYISALAEHGKQPDVHSHPGHAQLMELIATAYEPATRIDLYYHYYRIAQDLARIAADMPLAVAKRFSIVAKAQAYSQQPYFMMFSMMISLG